MSAIPSPGCFTCIDVVCVGAQTDGTNGVGFQVCAIGKILLLSIVKAVLAIIRSLLGP